MTGGANRWQREERPGRLAPLLAAHGGHGGVTPLHDDRVGLLAPGLLRVRKARHGDAGKYVCTASNAAGEETVHFTLTVTGKSRTWRLPFSNFVGFCCGKNFRNLASSIFFFVHISNFYSN